MALLFNMFGHCLTLTICLALFGCRAFLFDETQSAADSLMLSGTLRLCNLLCIFCISIFDAFRSGLSLVDVAA